MAMPDVRASVLGRADAETVCPEALVGLGPVWIWQCTLKTKPLVHFIARPASNHHDR
jgi:hypothetical protein